MKVRTIVSIVLVLMTLLSTVSTQTISTTNHANTSNKVDQSNSLTIYTYQNLMANPYYDIAGNFSAYAGIPKSNINIVRLLDANALVTRLEQEQDHPVADVVIGIDNGFEWLFNMSSISNILIPYSSPQLAYINQNLTDSFPNHYLTPYDYGMIAFYYNNLLVNASTYPVLNNLTFTNLANSTLLSKLITENPTISSTGLGFLLSTIAFFGDNQTIISDPVSGLTDGRYGNWIDYWSQINSKIEITNTLNDAKAVYSSPNANRSIMISHGSSPAYDYCINHDTTTSATITSYNGKQYGWEQIEGIGLVNNTESNTTLAKKFIDWFLSKNVQSQIPETNWMYPVNNQTTIPNCFVQSSLNPANITLLNNFLPISSIKGHFNNWLITWEQKFLTTTVNLPGFAFTIYFFMVFLAITVPRKFHKRKKHL